MQFSTVGEEALDRLCVHLSIILCWCDSASEAWHHSWRLLPLHSEHLWSDPVYSSGLGRRCRWLAPVIHHRFHVLCMRKCSVTFTL